MPMISEIGSDHSLWMSIIELDLFIHAPAGLIGLDDVCKQCVLQTFSSMFALGFLEASGREGTTQQVMVVSCFDEVIDCSCCWYDRQCLLHCSQMEAALGFVDCADDMATLGSFENKSTARRATFHNSFLPSARPFRVIVGQNVECHEFVYFCTFALTRRLDA